LGAEFRFQFLNALFVGAKLFNHRRVGGFQTVREFAQFRRDRLLAGKQFGALAGEFLRKGDSHHRIDHCGWRHDGNFFRSHGQLPGRRTRCAPTPQKKNGCDGAQRNGQQQRHHPAAVNGNGRRHIFHHPGRNRIGRRRLFGQLLQRGQNGFVNHGAARDDDLARRIMIRHHEIARGCFPRRRRQPRRWHAIRQQKRRER